MPPKVSSINSALESLGRVAELWLDPQNPLREETIQALQVSTGFSRRQIEMALAHCFEELTAQKLLRFMSSPAASGGGSINGFPPTPAGMTNSVFHVLPSNVFTAWVHGAVITLLLGHRCLLKPSMREPVFARAWKKSLERVDGALAQQVQIVPWDERFYRDSPIVVAYGSDETLKAIRYQLPPSVSFAGYGHKLSVGVVFKEGLEKHSSEDLLDRVRRDVEPFRLQGCLSPQILYVEDPGFTRWPQLEAVVDVPPKIKPFTQWEDVRRELEKFKPYLSCVGFAGISNRGDFLEDELKNQGVSRVCPLGEMQKPPLSWRNGGIFLPDLLN